MTGESNTPNRMCADAIERHSRGNQIGLSLRQTQEPTAIVDAVTDHDVKFAQSGDQVHTHTVFQQAIS